MVAKAGVDHRDQLRELVNRFLSLLDKGRLSRWHRQMTAPKGVWSQLGDSVSPRGTQDRHRSFSFHLRRAGHDTALVSISFERSETEQWQAARIHLIAPYSRHFRWNKDRWVREIGRML